MRSDNSNKAFELRAGMQLMTHLMLHTGAADALREELAALVARTPGMFQGAPMVLDLRPLKETGEIPEFERLRELLQSLGIVPVGIRHGTASHALAAREAGWAVLPEAREASAPRAEREPAPASAARTPARVIAQPVRSGQQVYSPGDLVLLGAVSPGAEVLADGCIHVYAPLRGRALAGVQGDPQARIFCQALHAELVSVAGRYRTLDDIDPDLPGRPAQVHLDGERLVIERL